MVPLYAADKMQPADSAEMEAETIIIHSDPNRGPGPHCAVLGTHIKLKKDPKELIHSVQGRTKLAGRGGGKEERQSACQLSHCASVFALLGSRRGAGWYEAL